jgi:CRP/FNR family transcriptional regulator, anaerobic regulatory protein
MSLSKAEAQPFASGVAERLGLSGPARETFVNGAQVHRIPAGVSVIQPGAPAGAYLYVISGAVRMQLVAANGRAVTLLRIEHGEPCVITTSCLFSHKPYPVEGVTEGEVMALTLPGHAFDSLFASDTSFRAAVLQAFSERVGEIILAMESSLFESIPARLARALIAGAKGGVVTGTHADLAAEIGSAQEVVSRQLSRFAEKGLIALERGKIEILDAAALARAEAEVI